LVSESAYYTITPKNAKVFEIYSKFIFMNNQGAGSRRQLFLKILLMHGVGLAYFLGSQKELGPARLRGEDVEGKPDSDLDLGVVLLEHPLDYWEGQKLRQRLEDGLAALFAPLRLHLLLLEEENAHVQYAAIRAIQVYAANDEFVHRYRRQVLTLYGDWHSWWS
jgi:predicted nucleotidyltransferase